jgi:hypothetical protein
MEWLEQSIKVKETFQNLASKANALYKPARRKRLSRWPAGRRFNAARLGQGDTSGFEKRLADMKAGRSRQQGFTRINSRRLVSQDFARL